METIRKITSNLAIAGQMAENELQQLLEKGYRSVVNLRSPDEVGFLKDEQQKLECLGLCYINVPIQIETLTSENVLPVIQKLTDMPKPLLVHCDSGIRSSVIVLMQIVIEQGMEAEEAFQKAVQLGLINS